MTLASCAAHALAEVDELVKQARVLLEKGQAKQAFELLEPQEAPRAGDPDFDTVLGIAANETEQFTRAVFALERVLSVQPENSRARAELGRALFSVGDNVAARKVLLETKKDNIPADASAAIDKFLLAIDRSEEAAKSSIKLYVETSLGYDTNINSGPGNANVAVPAFGGLVFTLNNANLSTKDNFATLGAGVSARRVLDPRWSLIGNLTVNGRMHGQNKAFDATQVDGNAGASYRYDKHEFSAILNSVLGCNEIKPPSENLTCALPVAPVTMAWPLSISLPLTRGSLWPSGRRTLTSPAMNCATPADAAAKACQG